MQFSTMGDPGNPAILFFHAMGVTGASSERVASRLADRYFCIMPTSTVYCEGQTYVSKADEVAQVEAFLAKEGVEKIALVVSSSLGADLACAFMSQTKLPVDHAFFDGGQFAQIAPGTRRAMVPFLWLAIKSLWWSRGGTLRHILWCDNDQIKPYFVAAGKALTWGNLSRQLADSLEDKPFAPLPDDLQCRSFWEFGSAEDHFKYRDAVIAAYPHGNFPVFPGMNHMQLQIRKPGTFAEMLRSIVEHGELPADLPVR